jgi:hypothetical protein
MNLTHLGKKLKKSIKVEIWLAVAMIHEQPFPLPHYRRICQDEINDSISFEILLENNDAIVINELQFTL